MVCPARSESAFPTVSGLPHCAVPEIFVCAPAAAANRRVTYNTQNASLWCAKLDFGGFLTKCHIVHIAPVSCGIMGEMAIRQRHVRHFRREQTRGAFAENVQIRCEGEVS